MSVKWYEHTMCGSRCKLFFFAASMVGNFQIFVVVVWIVYLWLLFALTITASWRFFLYWMNLNGKLFCCIKLLTLNKWNTNRNSVLCKRWTFFFFFSNKYHITNELITAAIFEFNSTAVLHTQARSYILAHIIFFIFASRQWLISIFVVHNECVESVHIIIVSPA